MTLPHVLAGAVLVLALVLGAAADAAAQALPTPFAPDWAMFAGWDVFARKGCGRCHSVRGAGGTTGPDLARVGAGRGFYDWAAAMWNHLPAMRQRLREARTDQPLLTARQVSELMAFLFTTQYFDVLGDARAGEQLFTAKGCVQCHAIGGQGGSVGPPLDRLGPANSPVLVAAAMWNHGPAMAEAMRQRGIARPTFQDHEMSHLIAYLVSAGRPAAGETVQVVPGTPDRGQAVFTQRGCAACHAIGGRGGTVGPPLGRPGQHVSLTRFTALMWNHGPGMWDKMRERGIEVPQLSGQDVADILAYLYSAHYFDVATSPQRGQQLVRDKGCLTCHSVRGQGGKIAADFARSKVVGSPSAIVAAMWNHAVYMEERMQQMQVAWPRLTGQELGDITAYLTSLTRRPAAPPGKP